MMQRSRKGVSTYVQSMLVRRSRSGLDYGNGIRYQLLSVVLWIFSDRKGVSSLKEGYLDLEERLRLSVFEYVIQPHNIGLEQEQLSPESFRLVFIFRVLLIVTGQSFGFHW